MIRRLLLACTLALWAGVAAAQPAKAASASASDCGVALAYATVNSPVTVTCLRLQADHTVQWLRGVEASHRF